MVIADDSKYDALRRALADRPVKVYAGADAIRQVVQADTVDTVVNALVGYAGLLPTVAAIEAGKKVALANKETLVCAGTLVMDAAEKFGSGEIAMTTRLTIEVQRIPFRNIEPFCAFLAEHGLETGGTGAKVRPVVACKGTTCQYGLIDTVAFSRTIHERFYKGWHDVKLPHKFKIAVGGVDAGVLTEIIAHRRRGEPPQPSFRVSREELAGLFDAMERIHLSEPVANYMARLVAAGHPGSPGALPEVERFVTFGASPRAAIALAESARAAALLAGRPSVGFEDVRSVAPAVLNHRLLLNYQARLEKVTSFDLIDLLLDKVDPAGLDLPKGVSLEAGEVRA